jgi:hypothetical protein
MNKQQGGSLRKLACCINPGEKTLAVAPARGYALPLFDLETVTMLMFNKAVLTGSKKNSRSRTDACAVARHVAERPTATLGTYHQNQSIVIYCLATAVWQ